MTIEVMYIYIYLIMVIQSIEAGDKITQGLVVPVSLCQTEEVSGEVYDEYCNTERGDGGFGSTGTK